MNARVSRFGIARIVVAAVLVAVGSIGWWQSMELKADAKENVALVDASATSEVRSHVSQALTRVLSYSWESPGQTEAAATELLTGQAREEFDRLFADLQRNAADQQLVLSATVVVAAVKELDEDTAELLVFVDQSSSRADDDETTIAAAQVGVSAKKVGAAWTITHLTVL